MENNNNIFKEKCMKIINAYRYLMIFYILFFAVSGSMFSQERTVATSEQQAMMENKIAAAAKKTNSMTCNFEQIKKTTLLSEDAVSQGKMFYRIAATNDTNTSIKNISLRWEYTGGYTFINNNDRIQMLSPTGNQINNIKMNRFFKEIMNTTIMAINGSNINDKTKFNPIFYLDKNYWYIALIPVQREIKNMFSSIEIVFNNRDYSGERIEITEKNGNKTIIILSNKKINIKIDDSKFLIK
jgi:outer membrane lipoprotein-sorting protein